MSEGDGGGDGGFGGVGGADAGDSGTAQGPGIFGGGLVAGGIFMAGGGMSAMSHLVPPTPEALRKLLTDYKQMLADGVITQSDYETLKARALGL